MKGKAARFYAAPTELGLIYWPKSTDRSGLTALSIRRCLAGFSTEPDGFYSFSG